MKTDTYGSANPLKIIKDYQSTKSGTLVKIGGHGSISYASNASTKDFVLPDCEVQRFNQIMNEPIENLVTHGDQLSRPASSNKYNGRLRASYVRETDEGAIPTLKAIKKERASTAHNKYSKFPKANENIIQINENAYHIKKKTGLNFNKSQAFKTDNVYTLNTQYDNHAGQAATLNANGMGAQRGAQAQ